MFTDLREYVRFLDDNGELEVVRGADWDLEIGGLTEIMVHNRPSPALLFDEIQGHEPGQRVLTSILSTPFRWSAAAGFEPSRSKRRAIEQLKDRSMTDTASMPAPERVGSGPVLENVLDGEEIDVTRFPAPRWHAEDGGRFIGTGDVVITDNRDTGEVNAGTYRVQVHDETRVTVYISPGKDGRLNRQSYLDRGEPFPVVVSLGHPPDLFLSSNQRMPNEVNELEYVGGLRGEPLAVVEGEATGLPIPAHSELVLEGHVYPDAAPLIEGPFGEWTGYYAGGRHEELPLVVERIYHRDDPITYGKPPLRPPSQVQTEIRVASRLWNELEASGIPGVGAVNSMPFGSVWFVAVSVSQQYAGHSVQLGHHAASGPANAYAGRFTVVVDEDIDVFDRDAVMWAICSRCDPATDIHVLENCWSTSLDPIITPEQRERGDLTNSRAVIDATRPYHWYDEFPAVNEIDDAYEAELIEKWSDLFSGIDLEG